MARIRTYPNDESIDTGDQLLGTDVIGGNTSNFTIEALASFLAQTGDADPSKIGFQFNYVGQNTDVVESGEYAYTYSDEFPENDWRNIIALRVSTTNRNGVDFAPVAQTLSEQLIKITDLDTTNASSYGLYRSGNVTIVDGTVNIPVVLVAATDTAPDRGVIALTPSGLAPGDRTFVVSDAAIVNGTVAPEGRIPGATGDYYLQTGTATAGNTFETTKATNVNTQIPGVGVSVSFVPVAGITPELGQTYLITAQPPSASQGTAWNAEFVGFNGGSWSFRTTSIVSRGTQGGQLFIGATFAFEQTNVFREVLFFFGPKIGGTRDMLTSEGWGTGISLIGPQGFQGVGIQSITGSDPIPGTNTRVTVTLQDPATGTTSDQEFVVAPGPIGPQGRFVLDLYQVTPAGSEAPSDLQTYLIV